MIPLFPVDKAGLLVEKGVKGSEKNFSRIFPVPKTVLLKKVVYKQKLVCIIVMRKHLENDIIALNMENENKMSYMNTLIFAQFASQIFEMLD